MRVVVVRPDHPGVSAMMAASDAHMAALYPAESNHMTDPASLAGPAATLMAVVREGVAVACGALIRGKDEVAELKRMFVPGHLRGQGHGKTILAALIDLADREGLTLRLETGVRQPEAIGLYRSHGFVEIDAFAPYAPDPLSVFMERPRRG